MLSALAGVRFQNLRNDVTGGVMSAVVAIPLAIGYGMFAFVPLGDAYFAYGVLAGLYAAFLVAIVSVVLGDKTTTVYVLRLEARHQPAHVIGMLLRTSVIAKAFCCRRARAVAPLVGRTIDLHQCDARLHQLRLALADPTEIALFVTQRLGQHIARVASEIQQRGIGRHGGHGQNRPLQHRATIAGHTTGFDFDQRFSLRTGRIAREQQQKTECETEPHIAPLETTANPRRETAPPGACSQPVIR